MRRRLRGVMPELSHYFGLRPCDLEQLTYGEIDEYLARLRRLPPIGAIQLVQMK